MEVRPNPLSFRYSRQRTTTGTHRPHPAVPSQVRNLKKVIRDERRMNSQMNDQEKSLARIYKAFNRRDTDTVLAAMHPAVDWPNGWEGGRVTGRDEVRSYWSRQWAVVDPDVVPISFEHRGDGRISVRVHQIVRDLSGNVLNDGEVAHVYTFENGLIKTMDIEPASKPRS
jgi:nuclear transport factor 2 (NTF2) superfamily protein